MALQDLPPYDPSTFLDPATGLPLSPADPRYVQAVLPYLDSQLQREAQRASNARGMFYSGPAQADEQQAAGQLASQVAQQAAQQAEMERQLVEQQQFQQQQQLTSEQAQMDLARKQGSEAQKAAAIGGGLQGLGTIGGMYGASKLGLLGGGGGGAAGTASDSQLMPTYNSLVASGEEPGAAAHAAEYITGANSSPSISAAADAGGGSWAAPLGAESTMGGLGTLGGAGLAAFGGSQLGGHHNKTGASIGSGLGGLGGLGLGMLATPLLGPLGPIAGAGLGSWLGGQFGGMF